MTLRPKTLHIQFVNLCNAGCPNCPLMQNTFTPDIMPDQFIDKIITQAQEIKIKKIICGINSESFLDKTFIKRLQKLRKGLPRVSLEFISSFSVCTIDQLQELESVGLNHIYFNFFGLCEETYTQFFPHLDFTMSLLNLEAIGRIFKNSKTKITLLTYEDLFLVNDNDILTFSKQHNINVKHIIPNTDKNFCYNLDNKTNIAGPDLALYINPNGIVSLSPNPNDKLEVGSIYYQTLKDICKSQEFKNLVIKNFNQ